MEELYAALEYNHRPTLKAPQSAITTYFEVLLEEVSFAVA